MAPVRPLVISAPEPRSLDLIFTETARKRLHQRYDVREAAAGEVAALPEDVLAAPATSSASPPSPTRRCADGSLRCVFNVETNLVDNMPYETLFARGIHVVTTGAGRGAVAEWDWPWPSTWRAHRRRRDLAFREGRELWGGDGMPARAWFRAQTSASSASATSDMR